MSSSELLEFIVTNRAEFNRVPSALDKFPFYHSIGLFAKDSTEDDVDDQLYTRILSNVLYDDKKKVEKLLKYLNELKQFPLITQDVLTKIEEIKTKISANNDASFTFSELRDEIAGRKAILPDWNEIRKHILQPIEIKMSSKNLAPQETINRILSIYGFEYDSRYDYKTFRPGQITFNPALHERHSSVSSSFPHNSIIEIKLMGIKSKNREEIVRKPWVVICFAY
jgi:hypothetical protein